MKPTPLLRSIIGLIMTLIFYACTSAPKAELSSNANPSEEITKLADDLKMAQSAHIDILARKEYLKSNKYLAEAREDLAKNKENEVIIDDLRFGKEALRNAYQNAQYRKDKVPRLLEARRYAIDAGAARSLALKKDWTNLDEDVAGKADQFDNLSSDKIEQFQVRYVELEKRAVVETQLAQAKGHIRQAIKNEAQKYTPQALRQAEMNVNSAEILIGSNVANPSGYKSSVLRANQSAEYLSEITETMKQSGNTLTEASAAKLVSQKHQIGDLKKNLISSEDAVTSAYSELDEKNRTLENREIDLLKKNKALGAAQVSVALQNAMEKSRQQFKPQEAEAYQQGQNLLIRLKSMNFQSGRSDLPDSSFILLAKISEVAKSLDAQEIKIEGHTDSVGTSELNQKLSEQRASAVADYFKENGFNAVQVTSEGHGYENPIATNKSKLGRAQNRRVDIIITPVNKTMIRE